MGLILNDALITIQLGQKWNGIEPTWVGSAEDFMYRARTFRAMDQGGQTDTGGAGHGSEKNRYHTRSGKLTLRGIVQASATPFAFATLGGESKLFYYIKVTVVALSSLDIPDVYIGVITRWEHSGERNGEQFEEIEADLNPDYAPAV